jgi:uncharacterized protein YhaN
MKLASLYLAAYGPFTGRRLDFPAPFTIVYGPNEAGKTSALRALGDALFGIPAQTPDDFLHPYANLRIGLTLEAGTARLELLRRKGNKQTLRAADDLTVVADSEMERLLQGLDRATFARMFGISHQALVEGGRDLADEKAEVGQLLFASGAGLGGLQATLAALDEEAAQIYTPKASSKPVYQALKDIRETGAALRHAELPAAGYTQNRKALDEAAAALAATDRTIEELQREAARLDRLQRGAPIVAARTQLVAALAEAADALRLAPDYGSRLEEGIRHLDTTRETEATATASLARTRATIATIAIPAGLLAAGDAIRALYEERAAIVKAGKDCARKESALDELRREIANDLGRLRPGLSAAGAPRLEPGTVLRERVGELADAAPALAAKANTLAGALTTAAAKLQAATAERAQLPPVADTTALAAAVTRARRDLDFTRTRKLRTEVATRQRQLGVALAALRPWAGTSEELERLPVPAVETIEECRASQQALTAERQAHAAALSEIETKLAALAADRDRTSAAGTVPSLVTLQEARALRELGWTAVKDVWRDGHTDSPHAARFLEGTGQSNLGAAYAQSVTGADEVADRMRLEAKRVERLAGLDAQIAEAAARRNQLTAAAAQTASGLAAWDAAWLRSWAPCSIEPESPTAMRAWLGRRDSVLRSAAELRALLVDLEDRTAAEAAAAAELRALLTAAETGSAALEPTDEIRAPRPDLPQRTTAEVRTLPASAATLLDLAEAFLTQAREAASRAHQVDLQLRSLNEEIARLTTERDVLRTLQTEWDGNWATAMQALDLPPGTSPRAATAHLEAVRELTEKLRHAGEYDDRIRKMRDDEAAFTAAAAALIARLQPHLTALDPFAAIGALQEALTKAGEDAKLLTRERKQEREQCAALETAVAAAHSAQTALDALLAEASAEDAPTARARWEAATARRELEAQLQQNESQLLLLSAGRTTPEFLAEAAAIDADAIPGRLEQNLRAIEDARTRRRELEEGRRELDAAGLNMRGGDGAATLRQKICAVEATLAGHVERYVHLRTAAFLLRQAIERYRERNQGPVLEHASRLFAGLTCGAFTGLRVESAESRNVLTGVRAAGGAGLAIPQMSDGTRDQLYLALRLASLEHHFLSHDPVPFIVDDVLLNFDDRRAQAALEALAELSASTQVIFFTHHQHLVDLARRCTDAHAVTLS